MWAGNCPGKKNSGIQLISSSVQTVVPLKHAHGTEPEVLSVLVLHEFWEVDEEGFVSLTPHPLVLSSFLKCGIEREAENICQGLH